MRNPNKTDPTTLTDAGRKYWLRKASKDTLVAWGIKLATLCPKWQYISLEISGELLVRATRWSKDEEDTGGHLDDSDTDGEGAT